MPHIDVKYFNKEMSEQERKTLADELCAVVQKHLGSEDGAFSVALTGIEPNRWKPDVYDTTIAPALDTLARKPGYTL